MSILFFTIELWNYFIKQLLLFPSYSLQAFLLVLPVCLFVCKSNYNFSLLYATPATACKTLRLLLWCCLAPLV